ncbi:7996_t:CDS:10 [Acaulospora colombiana]|uniref:7996_t:CDS:1 n=1 Tax=Acaulospora colombiana TaxID=27376 RepID=A0ACA9K714_9GLOM|nr:7996_t:CDS:10 [Acaulospora colombiana]
MTFLNITKTIEKAFSLRGLQDLSNPKEFERIKSSDETNRFIQMSPSLSKSSSSKLPKEDFFPPRTILTKQLVESDNTNKEISEVLLLRDIIFIFQGIDGQFIKYDPDTSSYIIDSKVNINRATRDLLRRLTELGRLYLRVDEFVNHNVNEPSIGLVGQAFCSALQHELTEYYRFIAILEAQVNKEVNIQQMSPNGISLKRLLVWTQDSLLKLRMMSVLVDCCKQKRGGALVSAIYNYTNHGDPFIQQFINNMLEKMLQRWIYEGELEDPFEEFFVACNPDVEEDLWQSKYYIRSDMRPTFISELLDKKIFSIGKSLNFIRYSCHDNNWVVTNAKTAGTDKLLKYGDIIELESSIDATYTATSQQLLNILFTKYKLKEHFTALKRYLLLGQGDFIQHLMVQLGPGLSKPANTLYHHNLTGTLEAAIRASNAQYDDPDILRRLDVRLLEVIECSWDELVTDIHKTSGDLDSLIEAHNKYLTNITTKSFLSTSNNQDELYNFGLKEMIRRDDINAKQDLWSTGRSKDLDPKKKLTGIQEHLSEIAGQFKSEVVNLLTSLANHHDTDLRFLSVRLNFNEYYNLLNEKNTGRGKRANFAATPSPSPVENSFTKKQSEQEEVEEIDRSQYPRLFPSKEAISEGYYDEETVHNDIDDAWFVDPAYENPQQESTADFVPLWQRKATDIKDFSVSNLPDSEESYRPDTDFLSIIRFLEDDGVENITLIDVRRRCDFADWIIIGEGKSTRHLGGAVDGLYKMLKERIKRHNANLPNSSVNNYPIVEGRDSEDWMLIDTGSIFIHLFTPEARKYRDIEGLWERINQPVSSKEELHKIAKDMEREFSQFDPKLTRRPPLPND